MSSHARGVFAFGSHAEGVFAVGAYASGVVAVGQIATGFIAVGQLARGFIAIGQGAIGVIAIGQGAMGITKATGMVAMGGQAMGMLKISLWRKKPEPPKTPDCVSLGEIQSGSVTQGWVAATYRERDGEVTLEVEGEALPMADLKPFFDKLPSIADNSAVCVELTRELRFVSENEGSLRDVPEQQVLLKAKDLWVAPDDREQVFITALRVVGTLTVAALVCGVALWPAMQAVIALL